MLAIRFFGVLKQQFTLDLYYLRVPSCKVIGKYILLKLIESREMLID